MTDLPFKGYHHFAPAPEVCKFIPVFSRYGNQNPFHPMSTWKRFWFSFKRPNYTRQDWAFWRGPGRHPCLLSCTLSPDFPLSSISCCYKLKTENLKTAEVRYVEINSEKTHLNLICDLLKFGVGTRHIVLHAYIALYFDCVMILEISSWCLYSKV